MAVVRLGGRALVETREEAVRALRLMGMPDPRALVLNALAADPEESVF